MILSHNEINFTPRNKCIIYMNLYDYRLSSIFIKEKETTYKININYSPNKSRKVKLIIKTTANKMEEGVVVE